MLRLMVTALGGLLMAGMAMAEERGDVAIATVLAQRVEVERQSVGMVGAVIEGGVVRFGAAGVVAMADPVAVGPDSVYEIGSITKVFTALLLADAVRRNEVRLDQPVVELLPAGTIVPSRNGRQITLLDLATHTSGLPRLPDNFAPADPSDPYADYGATELYAFLASYRLTREIGAVMEYSNLGSGLLGQALVERTGKDYEALVTERILQPLGMSDTAVALSDARAARLALGHDMALMPAANWHFEALVGAGGLNSTAADMAKFVASAMAEEGPLAAAFADMLAVRRPTGQPGMEIGLGWMISQHGEDEIVWHNGGTGGYRSFAGYLKNPGRGAVVLSNTATAIGGDDIGMHLLDAALPLAPQPKVREAIAVPAEQLTLYAGRYELAPDFVLEVTAEAGRLFVQATGQDRLEVFAESPTDFFYKVVDAQISFTTGPDGRATGLVLHQNGQDLPGRRVDQDGR